jgi:hypothetical protein
MSEAIRSEAWTSNDGNSTAIVDVRAFSYGVEYVEVSYDLLAQMLTELGYTRNTPTTAGEGERGEG